MSPFDPLAPKVLLVEDEPLVRAIAAQELEDYGFTIVAASNGDEAIARLMNGEQFDLIFTDIRMPGNNDGWQVASYARKKIPGVAVIYATGYSEKPENLVEGSLFFKKPYRLGAICSGAASLGIKPRSVN
ncbi:response regulator [Sphingomonas sp. DT-51]|uniref:response regulator n=1 Tax=Sphingomonas sp. DT-51 TaxID=3396165 RepID=UPI003F1AEC9E